MAQAYVNLMKRKYSEPIDEVKKNKVKRKLFCDEQSGSPGRCTCSNTPLSHSDPVSVNYTVHFVGYKLPRSQVFKCATCFLETFGDVHTVTQDYISERHCFIGELELSEFKKKGYSKDSKEYCCIICKKRLTVLREH